MSVYLITMVKGQISSVREVRRDCVEKNLIGKMGKMGMHIGYCIKIVLCHTYSVENNN